MEGMRHTKYHTDEERLLKTREVAEWLGVQPETLRRWAREGRIPVCRIGQKTLRFDLVKVMESIVSERPGNGGGRRG